MDDKEFDMIPEEEPHEEQEPNEDISPDEEISLEEVPVEDISGENTDYEDISDEDSSDEETDEEDIMDDASDVSYEDEDDSDEDDEEEYEDDDEDEDERPRRRKKKSSAGRLIFALVMVTLVISVAVLGAVFVIKTAKEILGLNRSTVEYAIEIPSDSGTEAIANILAQEHIIEEPMLFRIVSKIKGADGTYIAGIHKLSPNMTYGDIIEELQKESINPREFVDITFPEGIRLIDAAKKLEEAGVCNADEFIQAINSTTFGFDFEKEVKASAQKFYKMEGYFFPDTYQFYLDEDPKNVVKKVFKNFDHNVTPNHLGRMEDIGMSLNEVITLASI
ncbi:MAG: endolytic transglycosylase MltG, partial [Huintestinicola sp.]